MSDWAWVAGIFVVLLVVVASVVAIVVALIAIPVTLWVRRRRTSVRVHSIPVNVSTERTR